MTEKKELPALVDSFMRANVKMGKAIKECKCAQENARQGLIEVSRSCRHQRVVQLKSRSFTSPHHGQKAIISSKPIRICLDCGLVEHGKLDISFTINASHKLACFKKPLHEEELEPQLKRRSEQADSEAVFLKINPVEKRLLSDHEIQGISRRTLRYFFHQEGHYENRFLELDLLHLLWMSTGYPTQDQLPFPKPVV
jgi:hypothetical protein